ncbi:hypothetical protein FXO38_27446 [Capsicum annuum]|nr:hypothetical protein FXO38_27446 [Capsicum annuum]
MGFEKSDVSSCFQALHAFRYVPVLEDGTSIHALSYSGTIAFVTYDVIRKDVDYFRQLFWNYCILNKGHIIKNSKAKRTVALTATEGTVSPHSVWNANTDFYEIGIAYYSWRGAKGYRFTTNPDY